MILTKKGLEEFPLNFIQNFEVITRYIHSSTSICKATSHSCFINMHCSFWRYTTAVLPSTMHGIEGPICFAGTQVNKLFSFRIVNNCS